MIHPALNASRSRREKIKKNSSFSSRVRSANHSCPFRDTNSLGGRSVPRVANGHDGGLDNTYLPGDHRHAMHERSCCDEAIPMGAGIWHMERYASLGHSNINRHMFGVINAQERQWCL